MVKCQFIRTRGVNKGQPCGESTRMSHEGKPLCYAHMKTVKKVKNESQEPLLKDRLTNIEKLLATLAGGQGQLWAKPADQPRPVEAPKPDPIQTALLHASHQVPAPQTKPRKAPALPRREAPGPRREPVRRAPPAPRARPAPVKYAPSRYQQLEEETESFAESYDDIDEDESASDSESGIEEILRVYSARR